MSVSHTLNLGWTNRSETVSSPVTISSEGENNRDVNVVGGVQLEVAMVFPAAALKSLFILSSADCTIKTNSSGSPGNTLTLTANLPLVWYFQCGLVNPITVDVTRFLIDAATAARVRIKCLVDATP
jgi:hypothetical protein